MAFLGVVAAGVLTLLALAVPPAPARRFAAGSVLFVPLLIRPLDDPTPWAIAFSLLAAAVVGAALWSTSAGVDPRPLRWIPWATAAQWLLHADRIWQGPRDAAALVDLVLAPVFAGLLLGRLGRGDRRLALVAALLAFTTGPGWTPSALGALVLVALGAALVSRVRRRRFEPVVVALGVLPGVLAAPWLAVALAGLGVAALSPAAAAERSGAMRLCVALSRAAATAVAIAALITLGGGALPWSLDRPLSEVVGAVGRHAGLRPLVLLEGRSLRLAEEPLRFEAPADVPIRTVSLDTFLLDGAGLECGRPVAELAVVLGERTIWSAPVVAGAATGDWAAARPDVAARAACDPPRAYLRWPAPGGRFLSRRYRAVWEIDQPLAASHLELRPIEPDPGARLVVTRMAIGS